MFTLLRCAIAVIASLILLAPANAQSQQGTVSDRQDLINWYYAATFGTGVYTAGDRTVTVLQLPFSRALKSVADDGSGLQFKVSTTLGFYDYNFDSVASGDIPNRVSTLSVLPGFEWEFPLSRRWTVRPYADAGLGQELAGRESAWIYDFGVKSRFLLAQDHGVDFDAGQFTDLRRLSSARRANQAVRLSGDRIGHYDSHRTYFVRTHRVHRLYTGLLLLFWPP